jgi:hypothetical protein
MMKKQKVVVEVRVRPAFVWRRVHFSVLQEDDYASGLMTVITRQFFPELPILRDGARFQSMAAFLIQVARLCDVVECVRL